MFKLIALLFLASNPEPVTAMTYNQEQFSSKDACMSFIETEEGKEATDKIDALAEKYSLTVKYSCVATEDNSI